MNRAFLIRRLLVPGLLLWGGVSAGPARAQAPAATGKAQFFAVVGALILPRLARIGDLTARRDVAALARELADIKAMY